MKIKKTRLIISPKASLACLPLSFQFKLDEDPSVYMNMNIFTLKKLHVVQI